ncbi:hypothetical protein ABIE79_006461 [Bradyrhizobium diazoefficiens]
MPRKEASGSVKSATKETSKSDATTVARSTPSEAVDSLVDAARAEQHFHGISQLLKGFPREISKAGIAGDSDLIRLPGYDSVSQQELVRQIEEATEVDALLRLERGLMLQIERLEALERGLSAVTSAADLQKSIAEKRNDCSALFDALLQSVKLQDRELETQVRSLQAFLDEASVSEKPEVAKSIYVLNADPKDLLKNPRLSEKFSPLNGIGEIHSTVFGLWVLGVKVRTSDQAASIGAPAAAHSALAIMNVDTSRIPPEKRMDAVGERARSRLRKTSTASEHIAARAERKPLETENVDWLDDLVPANREGMESVALCFSPVRVRAETRYDSQQGDLVIPSSFIAAGKLFKVAMVSKEESIGTSPFQLSTRYQLGSYALNAKGGYGPFLYDLDTKLDLFARWPLITGQVKTGHESAGQMKRSIAFLAGQNTARGLDNIYQIPSTLSYQYLKRVMAVLAAGMEGKPREFRSEIIRRTKAFLVENLVGAEPTKPFSRIDVREDADSAEGRSVAAEGGIRLIIEAGGKGVISNVSVAIMPKTDS